MTPGQGGQLAGHKILVNKQKQNSVQDFGHQVEGSYGAGPPLRPGLSCAWPVHGGTRLGGLKLIGVDTGTIVPPDHTPSSRPGTGNLVLVGGRPGCSGSCRWIPHPPHGEGAEARTGESDPTPRLASPWKRGTWVNLECRRKLQVDGCGVHHPFDLKGAHEAQGQLLGLDLEWEVDNQTF